MASVLQELVFADI